MARNSSQLQNRSSELGKATQPTCAWGSTLGDANSMTIESHALSELMHISILRGDAIVGKVPANKDLADSAVPEGSTVASYN
jgi:hypothetical protein